jgi:hypothetical protein
VYGMASDACLPTSKPPLDLKYYVLAAVHDIHGQAHGTLRVCTRKVYLATYIPSCYIVVSRCEKMRWTVHQLVSQTASIHATLRIYRCARLLPVQKKKKNRNLFRRRFGPTQVSTQKKKKKRPRQIPSPPAKTWRQSAPPPAGRARAPHVRRRKVRQTPTHYRPNDVVGWSGSGCGWGTYGSPYL